MNNSNYSFTKEDPWRVMRIMAEFIASFEIMAQVGPCITVFGSARISRSDPYYRQAVEIARPLLPPGCRNRPSPGET